MHSLQYLTTKLTFKTLHSHQYHHAPANNEVILLNDSIFTTRKAFQNHALEALTYQR